MRTFYVVNSSVARHATTPTNGLALPTSGLKSRAGWNTINLKALNVYTNVVITTVSHIIDCTTTVNAWLQLKNIYNSIDVVTKMHLQENLANFN